MRDADELHDAMLDLVWLPLAEIGEFGAYLDELRASGRVAIGRWRAPEMNDGEMVAAIPAERIDVARAALDAALRLERGPRGFWLAESTRHPRARARRPPQLRLIDVSLPREGRTARVVVRPYRSVQCSVD